MKISINSPLIQIVRALTIIPELKKTNTSPLTTNSSPLGERIVGHCHGTQVHTLSKAMPLSNRNENKNRESTSSHSELRL